MDDSDKSFVHNRWVRTTHWIVTFSFFALAVTGFEMTMVHPRFYWGEVGNDLTPALFELPVSRNFKHHGYTEPVAFLSEANSPVSASRTYDIFNQNGWGRSLHFLSGWFLVVAGLVYLLFGIFKGHFKKRIIPGKVELRLKSIRDDIVNHLRMRIPPGTGGTHYGILQKSAYLLVIFILLPLTIMTGITMSPAIAAGYPILLKLWGAQSARTIHLFCSMGLVLFLIVHVTMIIRTGFKQHIRAMLIGK